MEATLAVFNSTTISVYISNTWYKNQKKKKKKGKKGLGDHTESF